MAVDPRVKELLEEIGDSGCTPEEVCAACPELLPEVRRRWLQMCAVKAELHVMFPTPEPAAGPGAETRVSWHSGDELPQIPGYEVEALLGRGGMGLVYKARHLRLKRFVALKMLITGAYAGPHELARFEREAEAAASLHHANIVQVHDVGDHQGWPYFTMELLEGGSLSQALAGTPQPAHQAATLVATLAEAVQVAHRGGIVHRDLKPANILLTAEGTPKVADFGVARHFDGEPGFTLSGTRIGTPSYMSPEQVIGNAGTIGPATDIYALGALLYEMLTGRPPFRGETGSETERQVIHEEPVSPSRLNPKVPRDLETICLKCLSKEPGRRYVSSMALADDLRRFSEGRPIEARPVGHAERLWRWGRRNPAAAALLATALALIGLTLAGGVWFLQQRAERRADAAHLRNQVSTDVDQAANLRKGFHFREARELLEQARRRLQPAGPDDLRRQVDQARADLELVEILDNARLQTNSPVKGRFEVGWADPLYAAAFANAGLGQPGDDSAAVAARARDSAVRADIIAALDDWAGATSDPARRGWLLAVARATDPHTLRDRLRQPELWGNGPELTKLVQEVRLVEKARDGELSAQLALTLGRILHQNHQEAVPLLTAAHARHPQDFWLNFQLGWALWGSGRSDEALGYFRAAMAVRPDAAPAYRGVGASLFLMGRVDEATGYIQQALSIAPDYAAAHHDLGSALGKKGRLDEAIDHFREAIRLRPQRSAETHTSLASALRMKGRLDEAIDEFQEAARLDPSGSARAHTGLGEALYIKGRLDDAISHCEEAIRLDPKESARAHTTWGAALNAKGRPDDAIDQFQVAIRLDPKLALAHSNLGIVLRDKGRLDEAIDRLLEAVRLEPNSPRPRNELGNALRRKGRLDEAIDHLQKAVRLEPKSAVPHIYLGVALVQKGRLDEAMSHYEQAIRLDPKSVQAHLSLGLVLRDKGRLDEAIGHFEQVVGRDPSLAVARSWLFSCRYDAVCAAVRAAGGDDNRQPRVDEAERVGLRRRALDWLRANIELTAELLKSGKAVGWSLSTWQTDPALAAVRDRDALAKLPEAEREHWQRLWADVAAQVAVDPLGQGRVVAARRDWAKAADCYARALKHVPADEGDFWFEYAALLLLSGDRPGYVKACAHLVDRCGKDKGPRSYVVVRACTLAPDAVADVSLPGRLAESELKNSGRAFWSLTEQGALAYRAGRFQQAVPFFEQSIQADSRPGRAVLNWLWLALTNQRLGKAEEARRWLEKARAWLDQYGDGMPASAEEELGLHFHNWLEAHVLRREAEALIPSTGFRSGPENRERGAAQK